MLHNPMKLHKTIYTLCRSGNHAIIFWIINNFGGYSEEHSIREVIYKSNDNSLCFVNNINHPVYRTPHINTLLSYNTLLISLEDYYPGKLEKDEIIILRDFYNTLASRYKAFRPLLGIHNEDYIHDLTTFIKYWKNLAYLAIASKEYVYYNTWLNNKNYRDNIMQKLFYTTNKNDNIDFVPLVGVSSSYIGQQKEADITKYLSRYSTTNLPEEWRQTVDNDNEIADLCNKLLETSNVY